MGAMEKGEPLHLNPVWERIDLLDEINATAAANEALAAQAVGSELTILEVLSGNVEPFEVSGVRHYEGLELSLVRFMNGTGKALIAQIRCGGTLQDRKSYDLCPSQTDLESISKRRATNDSLMRHRLGRTVFSEEKSFDDLCALLGKPSLLGKKFGRYLQA